MHKALIVTLSLILTALSLIAQASEIIERDFMSGGHLFHADELSSVPYPNLVFQDDKLLLITHSSDYWDNQHITWNGIEKLVGFFRTNHMPYLYLADIQDRANQNSALRLANLYYPAGILSSEIYPYQGDSHRIVMRGAHVVIAGGNFTICACNTVRSVVALSESESDLHIHYAMDAIYEGRSGEQLTLQKISEELNNEMFMQYLEKKYLNEDTLPCQDPTLIALDRKFYYEVYRNGQYLGKLSSGKTKVILHFESSQNVIQQLLLP